MLTPGPTMISCPACAGVVKAEIGPHLHIELRCSVGHAFSLDELYIAKEDQLEHAQWSLMALLKHLEMMLRMDSESEGQPLCRFHPSDLQHRREQLSRHITLVEHMIQETRLPSIRDVRDGYDCTFQEGA